MLPPSVPTGPAESPSPARLDVLAGGARLSIGMAVLSAVGPVGLLTPVPGGAEWLVGLTQWHGRLLTVVDAGRLFGNAPSAGRWLLVLRGAPCETALAVDELLGPSAAADSTATPIDAATLARHPAFQPGAAGRPPQTES